MLGISRTLVSHKKHRETKMRLGIASDIHLDHYEYADPMSTFTPLNNREKVDILLLAGDISSGELVKTHLELLSEAYPEIVFVQGNHDYWGNIFPDKVFPTGQSPVNVTELQRDIYNIQFRDEGGELVTQRILGCTLWTECGPDHKYAFMHRQYMGYDIPLIKFPDDKTNPYKLDAEQYLVSEFKASVEWLWDNIKEGDIVMTHHLPTFQAVDPRFQGPGLNVGNHFYASNLDALIEARKPSFWIHGHTHTRKSFKLFDTMIMCNARGYPREMMGNIRYNDGSPGPESYGLTVLELDKDGIRQEKYVSLFGDVAEEFSDG